MEGRTGEVERSLVPVRWHRTVLLAAALAFLAVGIVQAGRDAPTVDEGVDLSSGITSLVRRDLRVVPEHPALAKALAALPALAADPVVPDTEAYRDGRWFDYSDDVVAANERAGTLRPLLLRARGVVLLEAVGCAVVLYLIGRRTFGPDGGLLAAVAWLTTPYVVGISHFAMIDVPFTLATLGTSLLVLRWRERPTPARAAALGLAIGGALATRHTALVLLAFVSVVIAWTLRGDRRVAARQLALVWLLALASVWVIYRGLSPSGPPAAIDARFQATIDAASSASPVSRLVTAVPLPVEWRAGFAHLELTSTDRPSSLFGRSWDGGRWWYFPASAALKLPATLLLAVVVGWVVAIRGRGVRRRALLEAVVVPGVALWAFLLLQPLNLGLRLALPIVALALVGLGGLAGLAARSPTARVAVAALVLLQVAATLVAAPHSLAWSPPPWTPGYRWTSDANLDAGQALYEVRAWARTHDRPYVALDATRGLEVGGGSRSLTGVEPSVVRGWVAVGVTPLMQTRRHDLAWLRAYCPVDTLGGGSVVVYRFTEAPDPSDGPERPAPPCRDAASSRRVGG